MRSLGYSIERLVEGESRGVIAAVWANNAVSASQSGAIRGAGRARKAIQILAIRSSTGELKSKRLPEPTVSVSP